MSPRATAAVLFTSVSRPPHKQVYSLWDLHLYSVDTHATPTPTLAVVVASDTPREPRSSTILIIPAEATTNSYDVKLDKNRERFQYNYPQTKYSALRWSFSHPNTNTQGTFRLIRLKYFGVLLTHIPREFYYGAQRAPG